MTELSKESDNGIVIDSPRQLVKARTIAFEMFF
jgi:hypothetical protein